VFLPHTMRTVPRELSPTDSRLLDGHHVQAPETPPWGEEQEQPPDEAAKTQEAAANAPPAGEGPQQPGEAVPKEAEPETYDSASVTRSMTVGIVSGRGRGRDQFGRGKVLLLLCSGYIRFTDCSQISRPSPSTVRYWPVSEPIGRI
jgi:hypothetical protein